jgi:16S rRNA (guanine527-N7)-methyltransferase
MSDSGEFADRLLHVCDPFLRLTPTQVEALFGHFDMMRRWNQRMNLTRVDSLVDAVEKHYGESLFLASRLPEGVCILADVGSGAGFPGLPVAVVRPKIRVYLIESNHRKAAFLREASSAFGNVGVRAVRANQFRDPVDCLTSRAVRWDELGPMLSAAKHPVWVSLLLSELDAADAAQGLSLQDSSRAQVPFAGSGVLLTGRST